MFDLRHSCVGMCFMCSNSGACPVTGEDDDNTCYKFEAVSLNKLLDMLRHPLAYGLRPFQCDKINDYIIRNYSEQMRLKRPLIPGTVVKSKLSGRSGVIVSDDGKYAEVLTKKSNSGSYLVSIWCSDNIEKTDRYISGFAAMIQKMNTEGGEVDGNGQ